ncbi:MAG: hypothetical protein ACE148_08565 [Vicinamibacterales bacterium]
MRGPWRLLAVASALQLTAGLGAATAQTVVVRNAPAGSAVSVALNNQAAGTGTSDAAGTATLTLSMPGGKAETDARMYVDACEKERRIVIVERGVDAEPQPPGCTRSEVGRWFLLRPVTSMVVDLGGPAPVMWLRQGSVPPSWLTDEPIAQGRNWRPSPTGLVLFGGGSLVSFRDAEGLACGNVSECKGTGSPVGLTAGADYWFTRYLAAEAGYIRPSDVVVSGSDFGHSFESRLDTQMFTVAAKGAIPVGPIRIYGRFGANRHEGILRTAQTIDDMTVTVDDVQQTFEGGTQTYEFRTEGWGLLFGGGMEAWVTGSFALYAEGGSVAVKGDAVGGVEALLNDRITYLFVGGRFRIAF